MCLLAVRLALEKCLFQSSAHCLKQVVCFFVVEYSSSTVQMYRFDHLKKKKVHKVLPNLTLIKHHQTATVSSEGVGEAN